MTGTNCDLFTHKSSRSYLNHLVLRALSRHVYSVFDEVIIVCSEKQIFLQLTITGLYNSDLNFI